MYEQQQKQNGQALETIINTGVYKTEHQGTAEIFYRKGFHSAFIGTRSITLDTAMELLPRQRKLVPASRARVHNNLPTARPVFAAGCN